MGSSTIPWPTHGKAKEARDAVAHNQNRIMKEMNELHQIIKTGRPTLLDLAITINNVQALAADSLSRLIEQGAPYLPPDQYDQTK